MRKLFLVAAAALMTVPAFAATANVTLTIDAYSYATIDIADPTLHLNYGVVTEREDTCPGQILSGTNNALGAKVDLSLATTVVGVPVVPPTGTGGYASATTNAMTVAYADGSQSKSSTVAYDNPLAGYAFTIDAKLGTNWYTAPATGVSNNVTLTATLTNN